MPLRLDVRDRQRIPVAVAEVLDALGRIDVLVNNAGILMDGTEPLAEVPDGVVRDTLATNVLGPLHMIQAVLPAMRRQNYGRIVNISSINGQKGQAGQTNYSAAKAGMIGFSKSLAKEIGSRGITVNVVAPGFIDTDMTKELPEENRAAMLGQVPLGRLGESDDIANAVVFLASAAGAYITGETLRSLDNPEEFLVISTWQSSDDWKNWLKSEDRNKIQDKIDDLLGGETNYEIFHYGFSE